MGASSHTENGATVRRFRATWLSIQSLGGRLGFALVLLAISMGVGDAWSPTTLRQILLPSAAIALLGALFALVRGR